MGCQERNPTKDSLPSDDRTAATHTILRRPWILEPVERGHTREYSLPGFKFQHSLPGIESFSPLPGITGATSPRYHLVLCRGGIPTFRHDDKLQALLGGALEHEW